MRAKTMRRLGYMMLIAMIAAVAIAPAASGADDVNLALDWVVNGTHAGYFTALAKDYYRGLGLNVSIARGYGSGDTERDHRQPTDDCGQA